MPLFSRKRPRSILASEVSLNEPLGPSGQGLDSLGQLELFAQIEKRCQVRILETYWG